MLQIKINWKMAPTDIAAMLVALVAVVLFLTLLAQKLFCVITYSREELLNIRETSTYQHNQHYDQEYDFSFVCTSQGI